MSAPALRRLSRARASLVLVAVAHALLAALAFWAAGQALLAVAVAAGAADAGAPGVASLAAAAGAAIVAALLLARGLRGTGSVDAALWIERRTPSLAYALVTLADAAARRVALDEGGRDALERRVGEARWNPAIARHAWQRLRLPAAVMVVALAVAAAVPAATRAVAGRRDAGERGGAGGAAVRESGPPRLRVRVVPPAYARRAPTTLDDPVRVEALAGSTLEITGSGGARSVAAALGARALAVRVAGAAWSVATAIPDRPAVLRVARDGRSRIVSIEPVADSTPVVTLRLPARDTVLRTATGALPLAADVRDDLGLVRGGFEYIVSSGEGESFTFRSGVVGARDLALAARGALAGTLDLAALALAPGDIVHLRAVARDANPGGTPGASETRTLRIPRAGEYDSVSVEAAAPPAADKSLLSQRMLIRLTEALVARQRRLARADVVRESRRIGADQARLRRTVGDVVFSRLGEGSSAEHSHSAGDGHEHTAAELSAMQGADSLLRAADAATGRGLPAALDFEGDETPVVAINRPLLEAYNAMWDASQSLDIGEPADALPPMRRALEAIQRARAAERVYLRGRPPAVVVDLARVRLSGTERGTAPAARASRTVPGGAGAALAARLSRALALLGRDPAAATDSLLLVRMDAIANAPALARALADATEQLRAGGDATAALVRARRLANGGAVVRDARAAWRGEWSGTVSPRSTPREDRP